VSASFSLSDIIGVWGKIGFGGDGSCEVKADDTLRLVAWDRTYRSEIPSNHTRRTYAAGSQHASWAISDGIYNAMLETVKQPEHDRFHVILERSKDNLIADETCSLHREPGVRGKYPRARPARTGAEGMVSTDRGAALRQSGYSQGGYSCRPDRE